MKSFPPVFVGYGAPLQSGVLVSRRDRFLADVALEGGDTVLAHCVNPGRMEAFVDEGARVWLEPAPPGSTRKCAYTWEVIETPGIDGEPVLASTNTVRPNKLVRALLDARILKGLDRWDMLTPEHTFQADGGHRGRIDFLLQGDIGGAAQGGPKGGGEGSGEGIRRAEMLHYLEVKNCHLVYADGWGYFPDSVSERASRHVSALAALARAGHRCSVSGANRHAEVLRSDGERCQLPCGRCFSSCNVLTFVLVCGRVITMTPSSPRPRAMRRAPVFSSEPCAAASASKAARSTRNYLLTLSRMMWRRSSRVGRQTGRQRGGCAQLPVGVWATAPLSTTRRQLSRRSALLRHASATRRQRAGRAIIGRGERRQQQRPSQRQQRRRRRKRR